MRRLSYVDLARGLAALIVVVAHYRWSFASLPGQWVGSDVLPLYGMLRPLYENPSLAVQIFWLISGSVFGVSYGGRKVDGIQFAVWRFARLYPLHLLTLLIVAGMQRYSWSRFGQWQVYGNNDTYHFVLQLLFASNWGFELGDSFNGPIWSVSLEVPVYLAFFLFLKVWSLRNIVLAVGGWLALYRLSGNSIALCGMVFFVGLLISQGAPRLYNRLGRYSIGLTFAGWLAVVIGYWLGLGWSVVLYLGLPATMLLIFLFDLSFPPVPRSLAWIGQITYATYLLHMPLLIGLKVTDIEWPFQSAWMLLSFVVTTIVLGLLAFRYIERPAQALIRGWYRALSLRENRTPAGR